MPDSNNWGVGYSEICFFEEVLDSHRRIRSFCRSHDIVFHITLWNGTELNVVLLNEYTLGLAAVHRAIAEFPHVGYIVNGGNWNAYTLEAKQYGSKNGIGIFIISEFLGALHWRNPKKYVRKDKNGDPVYRYRSA